MSQDSVKPRRYKGAGKRRLGGLPFHKRHRRLIVGLLSVVTVVGVVLVGYAYNLNSKLNDFDKFDNTLADENRPDPDEGKALNVLLLGSDAGKKIPGYEDTTLEQDAAAKEWPAGKYRSDTLMILHVSADRKRVYLISIPRDTLTTIHDERGEARGLSKINAAFSDYGPLGAISTVENLTDLRMEHVAIIDWDGFRDLSRAVGGVRVYIPYTSYDSKQDVTWEEGWTNLKGNKALQYVRTRYGLEGGDFERIERQQNFIRALMKKMMSSGTLTNPLKLTNTLGALTANLTLDADWKGDDIRGLALSLRGIRADDVTFMTVPVAGTETIDPYGSVVRLDEQKAELLYTAIRNDRVGRFLRANPDAQNEAPERDDGADQAAGG